ncbi:Glycosyl Hydrolase Family 88 [Posidoniimonas polymericola]|uniref:Glycosyl Hydrolase Family 88 n=1 Tax=Posidoniimonas polymericola TaxID=2528002 RepID=A0A5C5ZEM5_9BACT|nr:thioredoxin domain-containing protein [Posidoniimonas polymericola]TWT85507.1 Glycosyl Hydrolase Family 88 [Posidoniimonas polymericola]
MPNHLATESSPYLLQHKDNPVDWRPWGDEALAEATLRDAPIFLSIGYSACHWCHVMEHESFENEKIAGYLNEHFVSIKVDREERPDLDQIYMNAVQMLTGRGGWPMSVFLTPGLKPFYGGTYWPATAARGMPGFDQVLAAVVDAWQNRRQQAEETAAELTTRIQSLSLPDRGEANLDGDFIVSACGRYEKDFDPQHGGFGAAPKFPQPMNLQAILRAYSRTGREDLLKMVTHTLDRMHAGGMYDHLGGGFARYSVDERWLVPHFEKMLYDNASLTAAYVEGFLATGDARYAQVARETIDYVLRDMTDPAGGFYSAEDADSEGEEGKFYVWKSEQIRAALGEDDADLFCRVYDVTPTGNFEGANIVNLPKSVDEQAERLGQDPADLAQRLAAMRQKLLAERSKRVRPGRDEKVLVNWNGLMIDALARAGAALAEPRYIDAARRAADFVLAELSPEPGRLLHTWAGGKAKLNAYLDDYAALAGGLISLYEATFDERHIEAAAALLDTVLEHFADDQSGSFFYTSDDHPELITRTLELTDNATPSGASLAATALVRLGKLTGNEKYLTAAHRALQAAASMMERVPIAMGQMLIAADLYAGPTPELVFTGPEAGRLAESAHRRFLPRRVIACRAGDAPGSPLLTGTFNNREEQSGEPKLYVCENHACQAPVEGSEAIVAKLKELATIG